MSRVIDSLGRRTRWDSLEERLFANIDKTENCWLWLGRVNNHGYGRIGHEQREKLAHRVAYELLVGPIPEGLTLDHLCRNPRCVNPAHLEPVTLRDNILRGASPAAVAARRTHCSAGHEFTQETTYIVRGTRKRRCRICHATRERARQRLAP